MTLLGAWDYPRENTRGYKVTRTGVLPIVGWLLAKHPRVTVHINGKVVDEITPISYREDIDIYFASQLPEASGLTGWQHAVNVDSFAEEDAYVEVFIHDGARSVSLGHRTINLTRPAKLRNLHRIIDQPYRKLSEQFFISALDGNWSTHTTSTWAYGDAAAELLNGAEMGLVVGAGISPVIDNVAQLDITGYPNIDVVSFDDYLPFIDEAFDVVVCPNVIEHVKNPFKLASEIKRVTRKNGWLFINGTNMHFTHGLPSHYFNPTEFGMRALFDDAYSGEYDFAEAAHSLGVIMKWAHGALSESGRKIFESLTIGDLIGNLHSGNELVKKAFDDMHSTGRKSISANVIFKGRKIL